MSSLTPKYDSAVIVRVVSGCLHDAYRTDAIESRSAVRLIVAVLQSAMVRDYVISWPILAIMRTQINRLLISV